MALSGCITAATMAAGDPASLERALSWIPHDASSFLVIPDLKLSDRGLFSGAKWAGVPLFE